VRWLLLFRCHMDSLKNMDLMRLMKECDTQDECRTILEELRWPDGVKCPRCQSDKISRIRKRFQYDCDSCRYQFSVTSELYSMIPTCLSRSGLLLLTCCACPKRVMSALQLKNSLHTGYQTAWYLCHRIPRSHEETRPCKAWRHCRD